MTIKIAFDSFEEMMKYADRLKKGTLLEQAGIGIKDSQDVQQVKADTAVQVQNASIPYGRQIAPQFPNANVSQQAGAAASNAQPSVSSPAVTPQPAAQSAAYPQAPAAIPTTAHEYTQDELASAAMQLMDKGGMQQLQQLLAGYGCETLQQLPKEQYGNFATALRGMGAQI